jgi:hypothetical protein
MDSGSEIEVQRAVIYVKNHTLSKVLGDLKEPAQAEELSRLFSKEKFLLYPKKISHQISICIQKIIDSNAYPLEKTLDFVKHFATFAH